MTRPAPLANDFTGTSPRPSVEFRPGLDDPAAGLTEDYSTALTRNPFTVRMATRWHWERPRKKIFDGSADGQFPLTLRFFMNNLARHFCIVAGICSVIWVAGAFRVRAAEENPPAGGDDRLQRLERSLNE